MKFVAAFWAGHHSPTILSIRFQPFIYSHKIFNLQSAQQKSAAKGPTTANVAKSSAVALTIFVTKTPRLRAKNVRTIKPANMSASLLIHPAPALR
jgi:hypothetical protein